MTATGSLTTALRAVEARVWAVERGSKTVGEGMASGVVAGPLTRLTIPSAAVGESTMSRTSSLMMSEMATVSTMVSMTAGTPWTGAHKVVLMPIRAGAAMAMTRADKRMVANGMEAKTLVLSTTDW